jgi:predicted O-methyltransferase YrrM
MPDHSKQVQLVKEEIYPTKRFSTDWTTSYVDSWAAIFLPLQDRNVDVLEIGSWEGRSAIFFLEFFKLGRLTCVDTFLGSPEHGQVDSASLEKTFDENVASYGARLEKLKSRSVPALDRFAQEGSSFDVIYIDVSHQREDVMADSALAWKILKPDGFVIWDDYLWAPDWPEAERPQRAIDAVLSALRGEIKIIQLHHQVIAQKQVCKDASEARLTSKWVLPRTPRNLVKFVLKKPFAVP